MKTISAVVVWFAVITTIAVLFASCGTSGHACDAYGQVDTEERIQYLVLISITGARKYLAPFLLYKLMIMKKLEELELKREHYQTQLEELHFNEPSESWYKIRRSELEFQIANMDEAIEDEKESLRQERVIGNVFIIVLYALVVTGLGILIFM